MCLSLVDTFLHYNKKMKNIYEPEFVKQLFNQMSGSYERMNYITSFGFSIRWRKQFIRKLEKSDKEIEVIDLLSGLGENWIILKKQFPHANFHALDFSSAMIRKSKKKAEYIFQGKIQITCEDILQNQFNSNCFDVISCAYGLKTFNERQLEILAGEIQRILKPNGRFSFVEVSVPGNKILLFFYRFYLKRIVPVLGKLFSGNSEDYKMLWKYTEKFENAGRVLDIFEKTGLKTEYESYFFGCATGVSGMKHSFHES